MLRVLTRIIRKRWDSLHFLMCASGILITYLINGIIVERISGNDGYKYSLSILFFPILFNCSFAYCMILIRRGRRTANEDEEPQHASKRVDLSDSLLIKNCILCACFYVLAMFCANAALAYVTYPMQVIGKSAKPIPVMIFSILGAGCRYSARKYASVVLIVAGTTVFLYSNDATSTKTDLYGVGLLVLSLLSDGIVALYQENIRKLGFVDSFSLMLAINKWAGVLIGVTVVFSGELYNFFNKFVDNREFWTLLFFLGVTSALGQHFIFLTISRYGPLVCSLVTTCRKCFAVLLSVMIFKHSLSVEKWFSMCAVFGGLFLEASSPT